MKLLKKIFISLLFFYVLLELGCFLLMKTRFQQAHFPSFQSMEQPSSFQSHIAEIRPEWGMWHYPNQTMTRDINCLHFTIHTNSFGARDIEREKIADSNRIITLGDSFIEGWGLNEKERLSNLLEKALHKEVLNFGCGWFTPTQEYLTYKYLAKDFSHQTLIWAILPFNDLNADDTSFHEPDNHIHYQPFFEGDYPNYHLMYREDSLSKSTFNKANFEKTAPLSGKQKLYNFMSEFTFWFNIYRDLKQKAHENQTIKQTPSAYYDFKEKEIEKLFFIITKLKEEALGKRIIIFTIPVRTDFERYKSDKSIPLKNRLDSFATAEHIEYVDLLSGLAAREKNPDRLYFTCDGHWNEYANKLASEMLIPHLKNK